MKHKFIKPFILLLLIGFMSCQDNYPDLPDGIYAEINTNKGVMVAKLELEKTPVTIANFVSLAEGSNALVDSIYKGKKYYDGLTFHRVIEDFMIQGGDPTGSGAGSPGYKFNDEFDPSLRHSKKGILSMANSGPNTNGSQFFITHNETPWLDDKHTVFGEVLLGLTIVDTIQQGDTIKTVKIIRKGTEAKNFNAPKVLEDHFKALEEEAKLAEEKLNENREAFIKQNEALSSNVTRLDTGVVMLFITKNEGDKPSTSDKVLINYAGYFEDGKLFDTNMSSVAKEQGVYNEERDKQNGYMPFEMIYSQQATLVPGFKEAMLNMNVGDKARVFIPSYLGYGERGYPPTIPPNTNLVFDLEITAIAPKN